MRIEQLDPIKLPLITRLYKAYYPSAKPKKEELTLVGYVDGDLACVTRFRIIESHRLLTGMLVIPRYRGSGLAHQLMSYCKDSVLAKGDFCFAYAHLEELYAKHNFKTIEPEQLPKHLQVMFERYSRKKRLVAMAYQLDEKCVLEFVE